MFFHCKVGLDGVDAVRHCQERAIYNRPHMFPR